ncbi:kanadaptin [Ixodes scapularis]|uniref:kanadaptin n=1 Tax=Ixodes scapularis TaxID=6945 RepID=UPI001A9F4EEA|nr:kanadaptin [Ixodes scapularis]
MSVMDTEVSTTTDGPCADDVGVTSSTALGESEAIPEPKPELTPDPDDGSEVSSSNPDPQRVPFKMPLLIGPRPGKQKFLKSGAKPLAQCIDLPQPSDSPEPGQEPGNLPDHGSGPDPGVSPVSRSSETLVSTCAGVPYTEPPWSGVPDREYSFQVIKNGVIQASVALDKPFLVVGRKEDCDVVMEHPSVSRYHAVVQFRAAVEEKSKSGFYVYDLGSTHGTFVNKEQIHAKSYKRLNVGHMVKFGGSSRTFILEGPAEDQEEECPLTVTELKALRKQREEEAREREAKAKAQAEADAAKEEQAGIDWGMGDDAEDEDPSTENPFALSAANEDLYLDDPKKTLRGWFEREGYDMQYHVEEKGYSHFVCTIELPIDSPNGMSVIAEASVKGKKKEAVVACALEACRILDQHGELRKSCHEGRKRKEKNWEENDFYDSDEDTFLDRTGTIEKKREMRKKMVKREDTVDTYDTLVEKLRAVEEEVAKVQAKLESSKQAAKEAEEDVEDSLEAFMSSLKSKTLADKSQRSKLRQELATLLQERTRLVRLANVAKPTHLPPLTSALLKSQSKSDAAAKKLLPMTGSMKGHPSRRKKPTPVSTPTMVTPFQLGQDNVVEEEEEEDDDDDGDAAAGKEGGEQSQPQQPAESGSKDDQTACTESESVAETGDAMDEDDKPAVIGPARPPSSVLEFVKKDQESSKKASEKKKKKEARKSCTEKAEDYVGWLPPEGQSGDGKTHLNLKYGY